MVGAFAMALTAVGIAVPYPWVAAATILINAIMNLDEAVSKR